MKRTLLFVLFLLLSTSAFAQNPTGSITAAASTCGSTNCVRFVLPTTGNTGAVVVQLGGTFVATAQFEASANPGDETSYVAISGLPIGSSTPATSATATGIWQFSTAGILAIQVRASSYASGTVNVFMQASAVTPTTSASAGAVTITSGTVTANQGTVGTTGWPVVVSGCSGATCYTSGVATGATVIAAGSTSTIFASTTLLKSFRCNNQNTAAVTLTVTDGNNAYFVGPSFSMPALSNTEFQANPNGSIMTSGVRASAGTAASINCFVVGSQ